MCVCISKSKRDDILTEVWANIIKESNCAWPNKSKVTISKTFLPQNLYIKTGHNKLITVTKILC